jgi:O-antigen/teichoic acid export membrane protein
VQTLSAPPAPSVTDDWSASLIAHRLAHLRAAARQRRGEELAFFLSNCLVNVANFAFFVVVGRLFSLSSYGAIAALLSVVTVTNTPLNAIQAAVVDATVANERLSHGRSLRTAAAFFGLAGAATTALFAAAAPLFESFFKLPDVLPVVMLSLWFTPSIVNSVLCGSLMGRLRFRAVAEANVAGALVRIGLVVALGVAGHQLGLAGPLLATSAGVTVTAAWLLIAMRRDVVWGRAARLRPDLVQVLRAFGALGGFAAFVGLDTIVARRVLAPASAGSYAAAATAGKIALYLSAAVPVIAYPRFVAAQRSGRRGRRELRLALVAVVILGALAAGVMVAVPHLVVSTLFGHRYATAAALLGYLAIESAVLGVVGLLTYFHVAARSVHGLAPWIGIAVVIVVARAGTLRPRGLALVMLAVAVALAIEMLLGAIFVRPIAAIEGAVAPGPASRLEVPGSATATLAPRHDAALGRARQRGLTLRYRSRRGAADR